MRSRSILYRVAARAPDGILRRLQDLAGRNLRVRAAIHRLTRDSRSGQHPIANGPAKGLLIDVAGSRPSYVLGIAEREMQRFFATHIRPGDHVLDVGANIGFFTLVAAALTGPTGRIASFEPHPDNAEALRRNVIANELDQVEIVEAAVSDRTGESDLHVNTSDQVASLVVARTNETVSVQTVTLDDEIQRLGLRPGFVKIDVEGHEDAVVRGMNETLRTFRPIVVCEVHTNKPTFDHPVPATLTAAGYRVSWLEEGADVDDDVWAPHLVAIPATR